MITDVFTVSYYRDAPWLEYLLRSYQKYARGFRQHIVLYPSRDVAVMKPILDKFPFVKQVEFVEWSDGHAHQTALKTSCDLYSDAEFFLEVDSDCVFTEQVSPQDYLTDGKADVVISHYDDPAAAWNGGRLPWKEVTDFALGKECGFETMRRFPFMYPHWLFQKTRARIEEIHQTPFDEYVQTAKRLGRAFHSYSEFCTLGAYALLFRPDDFQFFDTSKDTLKPAKVKQAWSWSGLTAEEREVLEQIVR